MYANMPCDLFEAHDQEVMADTGRGPPDYEARVELQFGVAYTLDEVAQKLGISKRQVFEHIRDRNLVVVDVGRGSTRRDLRVLDDDLEGFARRRRVGPAAAPVVVAQPPRKKPSAKPKVSVASEPMDYIARRAARTAAREARNA